MKAMKSEIKENVQGTNSDGKETGLKPAIWSRKKKHSPSLVGGAETGSQVERTLGKAAAGGQGSPTSMS